MPDRKKTAKLQDKHVLIIGGSSGIGYAVAEACLEHGARVTIASSQASRIDRALDRLRDAYPSATSTSPPGLVPAISGYACDLGDAEKVEANIEALFAQVGGPLDHIVYTAGEAPAPQALQDVDMAAMQRGGVVRFFAPLLVAKVGSRHVVRGATSSVTLTAGSAGEKPMPGWTVMASYAAGLHGMVRSLALELRPVRVNLVSAGPVMTELWDPMPKEQREGVWASMAERMATGTVGRVEDVAEGYVYLMKDANCTGSVIGTNGGQMLM